MAKKAQANDPVGEYINKAQGVQKIQVKSPICDRKACKIYPKGDDYSCRLYMKKGTEYPYKGETLTAKSTVYNDVDCDLIIEKVTE
eukprot:6607443-Pyramimonas_sp.AAC.2